MTSMSKNVYIDKLDDIFSKCNNTNTYHSTINTKPVDCWCKAKHSKILKKLIMKILNLTLVLMLEYQYIKTFLQKAML